MTQEEKSKSLKRKFEGYRHGRLNPKTKHIPLRDRMLILLLRKGISQNEICRRLGINQATISEIYSKHCIPSSKLQEEMCKILECDSLTLFENEEYWGKYIEKTKWVSTNQNAKLI